jgi:hypothetical protein
VPLYVELVNSYRRKGLLVDTSLLLLFVVGLSGRMHIPTFKRTKKFTEQDFDVLAYLFGLFSRIVTTPNIMTEVSNLLGQAADRVRAGFLTYFAEAVSKLGEEYTPSSHLTKYAHFSKFGLTDSATIEAAKGKYLVLTDDFPLVGYLQSAGIDVINFNHLRSMHLLI